MSHQVGLTVSATVRAGARDDLLALLAEMQACPAENPVIAFGRLSATHYARFVLWETLAGESELLFMMDCDAPLEARLGELVDAASDGLDRVFSHCVDYPSPASRDLRLAFLRSHSMGQTVLYVHMVGRTVQQIQQEEQLRVAIETHLDESGATMGRDGHTVAAAIRKFVAERPELSWAQTPAQPPELSFRVGEAIHAVVIPLLLLLLLPLVLLVALVWLVFLRIHEIRDPAPNIALDRDRLRALSDAEDFAVMNQITTLAAIKPGAFWRFTAAVFLGVANYSARHVFAHGDLAGLKTVHFARFLRLDGGRRVLFASYYDGSLESYMDDFVDKIAWVLNGVFGNEDGYPRTRWLFLAGARDELGFKRFLRGHQIATQFWYSAYPGLSAGNVDNNSAIRAGLYGALSEAEAAAWLNRL